MHTTVVMNAKGGVGKTTIATNLASYFAVNGVATTNKDYDPQGSSLRWIKERCGPGPNDCRADRAVSGAVRTHHRDIESARIWHSIRARRPRSGDGAAGSDRGRAPPRHDLGAASQASLLH